MVKQSKSILFIGAGASYGARENRAVAPPLGMQLLAFLRKNAPVVRKEIWKSQFPHALGYIDSSVRLLEREKSECNIENLLGRLPREEREQLHRLLQIVFCDLPSVGISVETGFEMVKDGYDELIDALNIGSKHWNIISLNYDILLEKALERRSLNFRYNTVKFGDSRDKAALEVYKPHGSINFFSQGDHRFGYGGPAPEPGEPIRCKNFYSRLHDAAGQRFSV